MNVGVGVGELLVLKNIINLGPNFNYIVDELTTTKLYT